MLACSLVSITVAQSLADINSPKVLPASPDAAALGKYGQIPVDKSTGIPNISIPLYEIKTPRFSLPISLSYHASGIKVDETASWVGIGWSLNAGGAVTRSINGAPDETAGVGYINAAIPPSPSSEAANFHTDSSYLENVAQHIYDTQPDNFFYNFAGASGAFIYGENKQPITIPYKPLKITLLQDSTTRTSSFTIIDEQGNSYWFHDREMTSSGSFYRPSSWFLTQMVSADKSDTVKFYYANDPAVFADTYYSFSQYLGPLSPGGGLFPLVTTPNMSTVQQIHLDSIVFKGGRVDFKTLGSRLDYGKVSLDSVIVSNYDYNKKKYNRLKTFKILTGYSYSGATNQSGFDQGEAAKHRLILTGLSENDQNNSTVKTYQCTYNSTLLPAVHNFGQDRWGYYNGNYTNQSLLESQNVISTVFPSSTPTVYTIGGSAGANRSVSSTYMQAGMLTKITYPTKGYTTFSYEPNQYSAPAITDTVVFAGAVGYYHETATSSFTALVTGQVAFHIHIGNVGTIYPYTTSGVTITTGVGGSTTLYTEYASTSKDIDENVVLTLTAGTTYQLNAFAHGGTATSSSWPQAFINIHYQVTGSNVATNVGGLRVKQIKNYNSDGTVLSTETYKYGDPVDGNESGIGDFLTSSSLMTTHATHQVQFSYGGVGGPSLQPEELYANSAIYPLSSLSGSPVAYETVTVYHGDTVTNIGKSVYNYTVTPDSIMVYTSPMTVVPLYVKMVDGSGHVTWRAWAAGSMILGYAPYEGIKPIPVLWKNGEPVSELHYKNNGSGTYVLVQSKYTSYNLFSRTAGRGQAIQYAIEFYDQPRNHYNSYTNINDFLIYDYPISAGVRLPSGIVTSNYSADGTTAIGSTTTRYYYDNHAHMYPTRIETYTSQGDSILKQVQYVQDMTQTGIYGTMTAANIISPVIQFTQSKNYTQNSSGTVTSIGTQLMQSITNYSNSNPNSIINSLNVSLQVMSNAAETRLSYLNYDNYGNVATVAKPYGPPVSYIWAYNGSYPVAEVKNAKVNDIYYEGFEDGKGNTGYNDSKTGHYCYLGPYSKSLTGLDNVKYHLTYWQKSGSVWTLDTATVTVTANTYAFSVGSSTTEVDDIRFYPVGALMTTYTYDPLIGVTSTTDVKGEITYYQYDSMQRLANIRDQNNNIVKSFCYNYAGQTTDCFINLPSYSSVARDSIFYRNNCGTGYTGSAVHYILAAGAFTSNVSPADANNQAKNDVIANAQNYANLNGTCIASTGFTVNNTTATTIQLTFTGTSTYYYSVAPHTNITYQIPTATYTSLTAGTYGGPTYTFTLGTRTPVIYSVAGWSSVNISSGSSDLTLSIH